MKTQQRGTTMNTQQANTGRDANGFKRGRLSRFLSSLNTEHPSTPLRAGRTLNTLFALLTLLLASLAPRAEAALWTPAYLPSTTNALWLDAADSTKVLTNASGAVTNWLDKSGNNRTFAQTVASNQPAYTSGGPNGLSVLSFTNSYLTSTNDRSTWTFLHDGTKVSMFSIVKVWTNSGATATNIGGYALWGTAQLSATTGSYVYVDDRYANGRTNNMLHVVFGGTGASPVQNIKNHTWVTGEYRLLSLYSDPGASTASNRSIIRANGTTVSQANTLTTAPKTGNPAYSLEIGALGNGVARFVGDFAEIVFLTGTTNDIDRQQMEGYLAWKWGMQGQLPAGHPYKDAAPRTSTDITVGSTSNGFPHTYVNATSTWSYTISGAGLTNNLTVSVPSPSVFTISSNNVEYGSEVVLTTNALGNVPLTNIWVRFIPTNAAFYSEFITNSSPGAATQTVQVTGLGLAADTPLLTVTPTSLGFGNVITNKTSADQMFTVTGVNLTNAVTVSAPPACFALSTNGTDFSQSVVTLATNGSGGIDITNIYVRFTPTAGQVYGGSITNSTAGAVEVKTVAVSGAGVVQTLYLGAETVAFGNVVTNTTSANQSFTVSGSNLEDNVTVTAPSAAFTVSTNSLTGFGQSCTVSVANVSLPSGGSLPSTMVYARFTPSALGPYSDNITCSSAGAVSTNKAVSGTGVVPPGPNAYVVPPGTPGASPAFPYNTWALAFTNIQDAVTFAGANQPFVTTVVVSNGTYAITAQITIDTNITVCSFGNGVTGGLANAAITTIRYTGTARSSVVRITANAILEGFSIWDGKGGNGGTINGGGVYMNNGVVRDCIIRDNDGDGIYGGGVYMDGGGFVHGCTIRNNGYNDRVHGGGVYMTGGTISNCTVSGNVVQHQGEGGGIRASGSSQILACRILENRGGKDGGDQGGYGGGIFIAASSTVVVRNCLIARNMSGNTDALNYGAGVYMNSGTLESCTIVSNIIRRSDSGGLGGGVYRNGSGTVRNCVIYFNRDVVEGVTDNWYSSDADAEPNYTCTTPLPSTGANNKDGDPLFGNLAAGDYTLQATSPCIDRGSNQTWMVVGATDLAGNARKTYGGLAGSRGSPVVDMGAYEAPEAPPKGTVFMIR
jgi:hypothetical protein